MKEKFISPEKIDRALELVKEVSEREGIGSILIGGVAMQAYGSPRLTKNIDFAVDQPFPKPEILAYQGPINFGGESYRAPDGARIDIILRNDEYRDLYMEAVENRAVTEEGVPIATPEYLAAFEFAANDEKHRLDLKWLLKMGGLVDVQKAKNIVYRHVGQRYGVENFTKIEQDVEDAVRRNPGVRDPESYP